MSRSLLALLCLCFFVAVLPAQESKRYTEEEVTIEKMFIEPDVPGDPFEFSDADTMLAYLNPAIAKPRAVTVFSKPGCPHCDRARAYLLDAGMEFEQIELGHGLSASTLAAVAGVTSTPQVFIDGEHIGGADELAAFLRDKAA